jgi:hypothetical protein
VAFASSASSASPPAYCTKIETQNIPHSLSSSAIHLVVVLSDLYQQIYVNSLPFSAPSTMAFDASLIFNNNHTAVDLFTDAYRQKFSLEPFAGTIYDVSVHGEALTPIDVLAMYSQGIPSLPPVLSSSSFTRRSFKAETFDISASAVAAETSNALHPNYDPTAPPPAIFVTSLPSAGQLLQTTGEAITVGSLMIDSRFVYIPSGENTEATATCIISISTSPSVPASASVTLVIHPSTKAPEIIAVDCVAGLECSFELGDDISIVAHPSAGELTHSGNGLYEYSYNASLAALPSTDSATFSSFNDHNITSSPVEILIHIAPSLVGLPSTQIVLEDVVSAVELVGKDLVDALRPVFFHITRLPGHGQLLQAENSSAALSLGSVLQSPIYYISFTNYFGEDEFSYEVVDATDTSIRSLPALQNLTVRNVNTPATITISKPNYHVTQNIETNGVAAPVPANVSITGIHVTDYDTDVDKIVVIISSTAGSRGWMSLNKDELDKADFWSCAASTQQLHGSTWICYGDGKDDHEMRFVAYPSDVENILNGMTFWLEPRAADHNIFINITIADGSGGECLAEAMHKSTTIHDGCSLSEGAINIQASQQVIKRTVTITNKFTVMEFLVIMVVATCIGIFGCRRLYSELKRLLVKRLVRMKMREMRKMWSLRALKKHREKSQEGKEGGFAVGVAAAAVGGPVVKLGLLGAKKIAEQVEETIEITIV